MYLPRLRDLREDNDLTQSQIAEILGTKQTIYSRYERGFQNIPLEFLLALSDYYNVSVDYILGRTDNPHINI
ncbi:MAG: helix-turn-helix transcriptional regulator [Clostridia bacterium]|nr:helix-turn-helix transcriptional regulator [Clostridia bacterium]